MSLSLFDPSNVATSGLSVFLFEKDEDALPKVEAGDVLLLRNMTVSQTSIGN